MSFPWSFFFVFSVTSGLDVHSVSVELALRGALRAKKEGQRNSRLSFREENLVRILEFLSNIATFGLSCANYVTLKYQHNY